MYSQSRMSRLRAELPGNPPKYIPREELERAAEMWEDMVKQTGESCDIMLYDNRSVSYRDPGDGLLFIQRSPHEVRPQADTGVHWSFNEDNDELDLSLNNAPQLPAYEPTSVDVLSTHKLCQACLDCFNYYCKYREAHSAYRERGEDKKLGFLLSNSVIHHFNLYSLLAWASIERCYLCQMLLAYLQWKYGESLKLTNYDSFRTEICWESVPGAADKDTLYFVITNPSCARITWNFAHFFQMNLWSMQSYGNYFDLPAGIEYPDVGQSTFEHRTGTDSPTSQALAISWFSDCVANKGRNHYECHKRNTDYVPSRLLDVKHARATSFVRLVCPASVPKAFGEEKEWITLSHCWGAWGSEQNPTLTKGNLQERERIGIELSRLPKTFQDALEIASWFNISWIWIDCLCIIQDSESDWVREATLMSETYQSAIINISADAGADSRAGCFVQRDGVHITPLGIRSTQLSQTWAIIPAVQHIFDWMVDSPSFRRAWIHRERQLSRRVLHFTAKELVWECCGTDGASFASELFPGGAPFKHSLFRNDYKYQIGRLQEGLTEGAEETYASWNDICEKLSEKNLTKPSDMSIILSSLAKEFARLLPGEEYVGGLWRSTLPYSLLWHTRRFKTPSLEYMGPSWSWLFTGCAVEFASLSKPTSKISLTSISRVSLDTKYQDLYGPLKSGTLHMDGVLRQVRFTFESGTDIFDLSVLDVNDHDGDEAFCAIGRSWDEYHGDMCTLELDAEPSSDKFECFCLFVTLQQWADHDSRRNIACLLLERVDEEQSTFARLGVLFLHDLYALKMRYRVFGNLYEDDWEMIQRRIRSQQDHAIRMQKGQLESNSDGEVGSEVDTVEQEGSEDEVTGEEATGQKATADDRPAQEDTGDDATEEDSGGEGDTEQGFAESVLGYAQGPDMLYHFDDAIEGIIVQGCFERLKPQILTII